MKLQDFNYNLPQELIAQYPLKKRDWARLLIVDRNKQKIYHDKFFNIGDYLPKSSMLVVNNSRVVPARLLGRKETTGRQVEVFLLSRLSDGYSYNALLRPLKKIKIDEKIFFDGSNIYAQLKDVPKRIVRFNRCDISKYLDRIGHIPLPPYIKRPDEPLDRTYYQTVYANCAGSVAAPTAGLHFTDALLKKLRSNGHALAKLTLHINYATFKPVEEEDIRKHKMHTEYYSISQKNYDAIRRHKSHGKKIVAVGTTASRVLETIAKSGKLKGNTNLFIYSGYRFKMIDCLITNFHLPRSTLLMLVSAFGGHDLMMRAYDEAIKKRYRFYSYGDGMLII